MTETSETARSNAQDKGSYAVCGVCDRVKNHNM